MAKGKYKAWLTEDGLKKLVEMAPRLTDAEMAREMGVSSSTYYDWLKRYPEMSEAVTRARAGADARAINESVEESLLDAARGGYGYTGRITNSGAQRVEAPITPNGKKGTAQIKTGNDLRTGNGR